jgi:pyruvate kinase
MPIDTALHVLENRRTKIVATVGPATDSKSAIKNLIEAGVDVFRLNMSHGQQSGHRDVYDHIRALAAAAGKHVAILADLCGPKIRVGVFQDDQITLEAGELVTVTTRDIVGTNGVIPSQYQDLHKDVRAGDRVLLADGVMELRVESVADTEISATIVQGGVLTNRKGINLPGVEVSAPALTEKDFDDARFALDLGVDFLAQSFVRRASDVEVLRNLIVSAGKDTFIIAKIERPEALTHIDAILQVSDGIMVARGDLGVELPPEQVPVAQSLLVDRARAKNKPVIVATQMLESMIENARPTRAEVADVANTVGSGADGIMLSAETATGAHPLLAVGMWTVSPGSQRATCGARGHLAP